MLCRYLLIIGNVTYKLGEWCVRNWDEISYSLKRIDYGGITRAVTSKFDFYGDAYDLIWDEYSRNYLHAEAYVVFETANDRHIFSEKHCYRLDFSSMKYDGILLSINAFDDTLSTLIKAKKNTQYEYAVSDLKEDVPLHYDRMLMANIYNFMIDNDTYIYPSGASMSNNNIDIYVVDENNEIYVSGFMEPYHKDDDAYYGNTKGVFAKLTALPPHGLYMSVSCDLDVSTGTAKFEVVGRKSLGNGNYENQTLTHTSGITAGKVTHYEDDVTVIDPQKSEYNKIGMVYRIFVNASAGATIKIKNFKMSFYYKARREAVSIDLIKPVSILNRLLQSMNGGKEGITGEIEYGVDNRLDNAMIVAAESARGLNAKLYTSYSKFEKWMNVMFGYVPIIANNSVKFVHRDSNYTSEKGIEFEDVNSFEYSIADGLIYSQVRVGYEKKEYDSVNGRDEFRWTNDFNTGLTITDNTLEMISPYRADAYGIELLVSKRGEDTTDNSSDNDVFFVCVSLSSDKKRYELVRSGYKISGVISPDTMFNSMYSPRSILQANKRYLGVAASLLKFASSEGNSNVVINGVREQDDFVIDETERLFTVGEVSFKSTVSFDEENLAKICTVIKDGLKYELYPLESTRKYGKYEGTSYKMCVKSILK